MDGPDGSFIKNQPLLGWTFYHVQAWNAVEWEKVILNPRPSDFLNSSPPLSGVGADAYKRERL